MGKGRIVGGGTDGMYTVELLHNRDRIQAELEFLAEKLTTLQAELDVLETDRAELVAERDAIVFEIDEAILAHQAEETPGLPDVSALLAELARASALVDAQDVRIAMIRGRMLEATKRQQMLQAIPADPLQPAWCADYTQDLTDEVGTVELTAEGEAQSRVIIRPGFNGRANYSAGRDGQMFHRQGQAGYQAYFNAAILPGVQKWRPQYRIGTILSINKSEDTCSLTIQSEDSSAQALVIDSPNLQYTRADVPIDYMECNAEAFETGDRVLIEFEGRDWNSPKVIGFESEPRNCLPNYIVMRTSPYTFEPDHAPIDIWNHAQDTVIARVYAYDGVLFRTTLQSGTGGVNWEMPTGITTHNGLFVTWSSHRMLWNDNFNRGALFYEDVVGEDPMNRKVDLPDDWESNEIVVLKPDIEVLDGIEDQAGRWVRTLKMNGLQIPMATDVPPEWDIYEQLDGGSIKMYRYTVDSYVDYPEGGDQFFDLKSYGSYKLEVVSEWEQTGQDLETFILAQSEDLIPETLTFGGTETGGGTKFYREKVGKVGRNFNSEDNIRLIAVVWRKDGEPPPTYVDGFWADEPEPEPE